MKKLGKVALVPLVLMVITLLCFSIYGDQTQRINYQPAESVPPSGFDIDSAEAYDPIRGYGWLFPTPTNTAIPTITLTPTATKTPTVAGEYANTTPVAIPDNDPSGVISYIDVPDSFEISDINVLVGITHNWIGELIVEVISPASTTVRLHDRSGGSSANIYTWYDRQTSPDGPGSMSDFNGENSMGMWALRVSDNSEFNDGTLDEWALEIFGVPAPTPSPNPTFQPTASPTVTSPPTFTPTPTPTPTPTNTPLPSTYMKDVFPDRHIPDNDSAGIESTLNVPDAFLVTDINIYVAIVHDWIGDLIIEVTSPSDHTVRLHNRSGLSNNYIPTWYERETPADGPGSVSDFIGGESIGDWTLRVSDNSTNNVGTLDEWGIEIYGISLDYLIPNSYKAPAFGVIKGSASPMDLYVYHPPLAGDFSQSDAIARNPSPVSLDSWVIPADSPPKSIINIDIDGDSLGEVAVIREPTPGNFDLYFYKAPCAGDDSEEEATARNPSPLARDFWIIPSGNVIAISAINDLDGDGRSEIAVLKDAGGDDHNLYIYNAPISGDWNYWDAIARNPSPLAQDFDAIPADNDTIAFTCVSVDGDSIENAIVTVRNQEDDHNLYLWNLPVPGDCTYWDAASRNPSPLARDLWMIPSGNNVSTVSPVNSYGERLAVLKQDGETDQNLYIYNAPSPGDWSYWDAATRNPSPFARDFWVIPSGDNVVAMTGMQVMSIPPIEVEIIEPEDGFITNSPSIDVSGLVNKKADVELFIEDISQGVIHVIPGFIQIWTTQEDWENGNQYRVDTQDYPGRVSLASTGGGVYYTYGTLVLDYDAGQAREFDYIQIWSEEPQFTDIGVRCKVADTQSGLDDAEWSSYNFQSPYLSGSVNGRWIRVEIVLQTTNLHSTPELIACHINFINDSFPFLFSDIPINEGQSQAVRVEATAGGENASYSISINCDRTDPDIAITDPLPEDTIIPSLIPVEGTVDIEAVTVTIDGQPAEINGGTFSAQDIQLSPGDNMLTAVATDAAGNEGIHEVIINYDADLDNDGLSNDDELAYWGDDWDADFDSDELINILDDDSDNDGLLDGYEYYNDGLDPSDSDTDDDTILDGADDHDGDNITNSDEQAAGTDPNNPDTSTPEIQIHYPVDSQTILYRP